MRKCIKNACSFWKGVRRHARDLVDFVDFACMITLWEGGCYTRIDDICKNRVYCRVPVNGMRHAFYHFELISRVQIVCNKKILHAD